MNTDSKRTVLVIEDDDAIAEAVSYNLQREGYRVLWSRDGRDGLHQARSVVPDLIILDLMLPGIDGIEICRELRVDKLTRNIGIVMLTAKGDETDQIIGFTVGADDYVTKPFSVKVLMQRVRALLGRRYKADDEADLLELHRIRIDRIAHQAYRDGQILPLTPTEYRLLETMMRHPGRAFTRNDLLSSAVGADTIVLERTIDVHIRSLRQKLGDAASAIETVRGIGYRLARELPLAQEP